MKTKTIVTLVGATTFALAFVSCDSKEEQARKERLEMKADHIEATADQLRKDGEKVAEMKEEHANAIRKSSEAAADMTEESANATRDVIEKRADEIEAQADKVREQK